MVKSQKKLRLRRHFSTVLEYCNCSRKPSELPEDIRCRQPLEEMAGDRARFAGFPASPVVSVFLKVCEGIDRAGKCEPAPGRSSASPPQAESFGILGSKLQFSLIRGTLCNVLWGLIHKKKHCWRSSSTQKTQKNPPHFWFFWFFSKPFCFFLSGDTPPPRPSK